MRIPVRVIRPEDVAEDENRNQERRKDKDVSKGADSMADNRDVKQEYEAYYEEPEEKRAEQRKDAKEDQANPEAQQRTDFENWRDKYTRLFADFENFKRNTNRERERLAAAGKEAVLEDVFPIIEHMERAIDSAKGSEDTGGILQGLEMVYRELLSVLEKHGVERIRATGETFDPQLHEAVSVASSEEHPEGTILEELRPGFTRGGRLLRPAQVIVAQ